MEAASAKAINILATLSTKRFDDPIAVKPSPSWSSSLTRQNFPSLCASNPIPRSKFLFLSCCSTKPDTNTNNEADSNSTVELNTRNPETPSTPASKNPFSFSSSSSSPKNSKGLVFDLGSAGSWDSREIGSPVVKRFLSDEEERWYMWYSGTSIEKPGLESVGLAVSSNGVHWKRGVGPVGSSSDAGMVMSCSKDWWAFDTESIRPCEVLIMSSSKVRASSAVYWLYYTGYSSENVDFMADSIEMNLENPERLSNGYVNVENGINRKALKSLPGLAISQDGRQWARIEGEHHSGALFDVGTKGEWDSLFIAAPQVVFHENGDLRMYYHSFDVEKGQYGIGVARSRDGMKWMKLGKVIGGGRSGSYDEFGAMDPQVVRNRKDGDYVMVYEGVDAKGARSIGLAVSPNGLKDWRRFQDDAVLKPSMEDGWDDEGVGCPCLVQMNETEGWRLYYRGLGKGRTGIGMAVSEGSDIRSFRRWEGFHL